MSSPSDKRSPRRSLKSFLRNERGTVAVITAATAVPLFLSMGLAVDLTRAYTERTRLTAALDAAGLAVGANPSMTPAQAASVVSSYLQANFPNSGAVTVNTPTVSENNTSITVAATATIKTSFMGLIPGLSTLPITAQSTVSFAGNLEVALVLDNTGSLAYVDSSTGQSNISALKTAAGELVVTLFGTTTTNNPKTRVGIVPYVAAVNPGPVAPNMLNNPPTLMTFDPTKVESTPSGWTGCVVERASTFATVTAAAVAADLDTPVSAAKSNYLTQYIWPKTGHTASLNWTTSTINAGPFTGGVSAAGPNQSCPTPAVPLTSNSAPLLAAIGANATTGVGITDHGMEDWQNGGTIGSIGMAWGYRMLSPNGPYAAAGLETVSAWNTPGWQKVVVLMTDGVNNINSNGGIIDYNGAPGVPPSVATVDKQEEAVCDALKAQNVVIYSVFLNSNSTPGPALAYCAGTTVGKGDTSYYYVAQNQAALYTAFQTIANDLTKLRVSK